LEAGYSTALTGQQALFYENILLSPTINVLSQLSGEANAGAGQIAAFQLTNQFLLLMLNPFGQDRSGFGASASGPPGGLVSRFAPEREMAPAIAQAYAAVTPEGRAVTYWTPRRHPFLRGAHRGHRGRARLQSHSRHSHRLCARGR
jgi:hypothetical protein